MKKCAVWAMLSIGLGLNSLWAEPVYRSDLRLGLEHQEGSQGAIGGSLGVA